MGVSFLLGAFEIKPQNVRAGDLGITKRGYKKDHFADAITRYSPSQGATTLQVKEPVGYSGDQGATSKSSVAPSKPRKPAHSNVCSVVAPETPPSGKAWKVGL